MVSVLVVLLAMVPTTPWAVPPMLAVPLPLSKKPSPDGIAPISLIPATVPLVWIVTDSDSSTVNVAALPLMMAGVTAVGASLTVRVYVWVVIVPVPLPAMKLRSKVPVSCGVPLKVTLPSLFCTTTTPAGRLPLSYSESIGALSACTSNVPGWPSVNEVAFWVTNAGVTAAQALH